MKSRILLMSLLAGAALEMQAQDTYVNAQLAKPELNGTARYVGMGGAMDALGADVSTIGTNPAGIALFRSSSVSGTVGYLSQQGVKNNAYRNQNMVSFDQLGIVWNIGGYDGYTFAFNYSKSNNFHQILRAAGQFQQKIVDGREQYISSLNKTTYEKLKQGVFSSNEDNTYTYLDDLMLNAVNTTVDADGKESYVYTPAESWAFDGGRYGYINNYDFNFSKAVSPRFFFGMTLGVKDVNYHHRGSYVERLVPNLDNWADLGTSNFLDIDGVGLDFTAGVIFRPFESSPLRVGLSVATPTMYDLSAYSGVNLYVTPTPGVDLGDNTSQSIQYKDKYDFRFNTPWKFGVSLGHTIGDYLALGLSYQYADYSSSDTRIIDDYYYDGTATSSSDEETNASTRMALKGVSTVKAGFEMKVTPNFAVRAGYNYESPMYNKDGQRFITPNYSYVNSLNTGMSTSNEFINWKATNRFTCGLGYSFGKCNLDFAYQYTSTKGVFYPFTSLTVGDVKAGDNATVDDNLVDGATIENNRHHLSMTFTYRF